MGRVWLLAGLASVAVAACGGGGGGDADRLRFEMPPEVSAGPSSTVPLARIVTATVNEPARIEVTASDGSHTVHLEPGELSTSHARPLLGLKPGRTYQLVVTAIAEDGERRDWDQPLSTTTDPLPENFPVLDVRIADAARMEPGFTLFGLRNKNVSAAYLVILDDRGDVVWFLAVPVAAVVTPLANGRLAYITGDRTTIREINFLGEISHTWYADRLVDAPPEGGAAVDSFAFHNDIFEAPADGTLLVPVQETRVIDDFPVDEENESVRATATVLDEPIIEFDRNGSIVRRWDFLDILNPRRISFDSTLGLEAGAADWVHTNAVTLDPRDNSIFVSFRHQDAVVKVSRTDGTLEYILGNHDNWEGFEQFLLTPVGEPFEWPYHQHAPQITAEGTLLLFDNGNYKASPFTGEERVPAAVNDSRAVEYAIDEDAKTIRQVWEYVHPEQLYAPFVGSAYQLATTRNVLITYGGLCTIDGVYSDDIGACRGTARILEVDRGEPDTVVFDVFVADRDPNAFGWLIYRSLRLPSFGE